MPDPHWGGKVKPEEKVVPQGTYDKIKDQIIAKKQ